MSDRVLIALPDGRWLALSRELFEEALAEGSALMSAPGCTHEVSNEALVDANELAERFNVSVTWIEQAARDRRIPSHEFGRWRRFKASEVAEACRQRTGNGA